MSGSVCSLRSAVLLIIVVATGYAISTELHRKAKAPVKVAHYQYDDSIDVSYLRLNDQ